MSESRAFDPTHPQPLDGRLGAILESVADGVTVQRPCGEIVYANLAAVEQLGFASLQELLSVPLQRLMSRYRLLDEQGNELRAEQLPGRRALRERHATESVVRFSTEGAPDDRWALVKAMPVFDDEGAPVYAVSVFRDVTLERRNEAHARFLAEAVQALSESLDTASTLNRIARLAVPMLGDQSVVDLVDESGVGRHVAQASVDPANEEAFRQLLRYPTPQRVLDVARTLRSRLVSEPVLPVLVEGAVDDAYVQILRRLAPSSVLTVPIVARGRVLGAITVGMACSGRHHTPELCALAEEFGRRAAFALDNAQLVESLRLARERAEAATRSREDLLTVVSHDLRNPLSSVILGASMLNELLARDGDSEAARRHVETIQLAALSMDRLIRDLVELSRIDAGNLSIEPRSVNVDELVRQAAELFRPLAADKAQRLELASSCGGVRVVCDRERVLQILGNLVGNAIKFTPPGGTITLSAFGSPDQVVMSVSDTGPGISPQGIEHIFDRYWQDKSDRGGLGLGLSIAKGLVEAHGGRIWAESELGRGTTLSVSLPVTAHAELDRPAS
jgi:PAS domain S-box-containing protein